MAYVARGIRQDQDGVYMWRTSDICQTVNGTNPMIIIDLDKQGQTPLRERYVLAEVLLGPADDIGQTYRYLPTEIEPFEGIRKTHWEETLYQWVKDNYPEYLVEFADFK